MRIDRRELVSACLAAGALHALPTAAWGQAKPGAEKTEPEKRYRSDYFSFIGADAKGTVYLAHDNNRGQTGDKFFADHWVMLWAEGEGLVPVSGSQHYPNTGKVLDTIPDSEDFQFRGDVATGIRMTSRSNGLEMTVGALKPILRRRKPDHDQWVGAAPATMSWKGRTLQGRVINEYIDRTGYNRFTGNFGANWNNFNGLYLLTDDGRDVYLRHHERTDLPANERQSGMATLAGEGELSAIDFRIVESRAVENRTYRWPLRWQVGFSHGGASWRLEAETVALEEVADWEKGGFAMSIIKGTVAKADGSGKRAFKGWAELLI